MLIVSAAFCVSAADSSKKSSGGSNNTYTNASQQLDNQYGYDGKDLGATYTESATTFKIWAPTATSVKLNLYSAGSGGSKLSSTDMVYNSTNGVWSLTMEGDYKNKFYTYSVTAKNVTGSKTTTKETQDIYSVATGVNGQRSQIVDLNSTNPEGWNSDKHVLLEQNTDSYVWEVHVKDFSYDSKSGISSANRGKYLAFTETGTTLNNEGDVATGIDYLKKLGVTTVQIMPFFDYSKGSIDETGSDSQFNWGYDPVNFNVPEGSYSSNPYDGNVRIKECKQMIQALHNAGISVVMDVVYNHTSNSNPSFEACVPNYYYRMTSSGNFSNGTGCGNETASERRMFRNFMIQSCLYWVNEYHIDGFRFDLMGVHDVETMNLLRAEMDKVDPRLTIWGEGWTGGSCTYPATTCTGQTFVEADRAKAYNLNERIGFFNDVVRDAVKGSVFDKTAKGWVQGDKNYSSDLNKGVMANTSGTYWTVKQPSQTVTYTSCHDNQALYDKLACSQGITDYRQRNETLVKQNKLAGGLLQMSQGVTFTQAGEEMCRSKDNDDNSYVSSVTRNMIDWSLAETNADVADYYKGMREIREKFSPLRDNTKSALSGYKCYSGTTSSDIYAAVWTNSNPNEWKKLAVIANNSSSSKYYTLNTNEGLNWVVIADKSSAGVKKLEEVNSGTIKVDGYSMVVAVDKPSFDSLDEKVYTSENGEKINLSDKIKKAEDDTELKGIGNEFKNLQILGVQKKKDTSKHDLRFVSVINSKVAQDAKDYGYIAVGAANKKAALNALEGFTLDSAPVNNVFSCKGTSNKISGDYGKFSSDTDYKYVTYSINDVGDNFVAVMFYVKDKNGNVFYAPYTNASGTTNACVTDWQTLG
jgi:type I pullulanase